MKNKRILSMILVWAMALSLLPQFSLTAFAAGTPDTSIGLNLTGLTADWTGTGPYEGVSWVNSTKTLTLTNANIHGIDSTTINELFGIKVPGGTTVVLNGNNTVTGGISSYSGGYSFGLYSTGNLTIQGTGSLVAAGGPETSSNGNSRGIYAGTMTIISGTVIASGGWTNSASGSSCGIQVPTLTISGGIVTATTDSAYTSVCLFADTVNLSGGLFICRAGITGNEARAFRRSVGGDSTLNLSGGINTIVGIQTANYSVYGSLSTYKSSTTALDFSSNPANSGILSTNGYQWVQSTKTLSIKNYILTPTIPQSIMLPAGSTLDIQGINVIKGIDSTGVTYGILCSGALTVNNTGTMNVICGKITSGSVTYYGVYANGAMNISSATVNVIGGTSTKNSYGLYSNDAVNISSGNITAIGGTITATTGSCYSCGIMSNSGSATISGGNITAIGGTVKSIDAGHSAGLYDNYDMAITGGNVAAIGGATSCTTNYNSLGINIIAATSKLTVSGGNITAIGNVSAYFAGSGAGPVLNNMGVSIASTNIDGSGPVAYNSANISTYKYLKVVPTYTATVYLKKDGSIWTGSGKTITLQQASEAPTATNEVSGVFTVNVLNGTWKILAGGVDTGLTVVINNGAAAQTLNYYTVNFSVTNFGTASGSSISATYNSAGIASGAVVPGGKQLVITVVGNGAGNYSYSWTGAGTNSETSPALTIANLNSYVAATCAVTGTTAPAITTASLPNGTVGTVYNQTLSATGSTPITWSIASGSLPTGLSLNTNTGAITGTPTTAGTSSFTVNAGNGISPDATRPLNITILPVPVTNITGLPTTGTVSTAVTLSGSVIPANATNQTITWSKGVGSTAAGADVSFNLASATGAGTVNVVATITNGTALGSDYTKAFTITFSATPTYNAAIGPASKDFGTSSAGYASIAPQLFAITNTGTGVLTSLLASFSSGSNFEISTPLSNTSVALGGTEAISIKPKDGLLMGTYSDTLVITGDNGLNVSASLLFNVTAALTVPGAPQNFTAAPGNTQTALSWNAPASDGGSAITKYQVSKDNGSTWIDVTSGTAYTFTGLTNGALYTFKVHAVNAVGSGTDSTVTATPFVPAADIINLPLTGTIGTPLTLSGNVQPANATNQTIIWSLGGGSTAAGANVSGNQAAAAGSGTVNVMAIITNGIAVGSNYTKSFTIIFSDAPTYNAAINPASEDFGTNPAGYAAMTPQQFTITNTGTGVLTSLAASLNSGSNFEISTPLSGTSVAMGNTATISIKPKDNLAVGTYSDTLGITGDNGINVTASLSFNVIAALAVPGIPQNFTATPGNSQVTLNWDAPASDGGSSITKYEVSRDNGSTWIDVVSGTAYTYTGLATGTQYTFKVHAVNAMGNGADASTILNYQIPNNTAPQNNTSNETQNNTGNGGKSSSGSSGGNTSSPASSGVDIIVNSNTINAGTAANSTEGGKTVTTITVDQQKLDQKLATEGNNALVIIPVNTVSDKLIGQLNGQMIKNMENKQATLEVRTGPATYTLPASEINIDAVSAKLGTNVTLSNITVQVAIASPSAQTITMVMNAAKGSGFSVTAPAIDFNINCTYNGKTVNVSTFNSYVERTVAIPYGIDPKKITTGIVVDPEGKVRHVPTKVTIIDGKYYAVINSLTNSTYTVIWHPVEFADVKTSWARDAINDMGSRMVVSGYGNNSFIPNKDITRAEFAAIIVRALGLAPGTGRNGFRDVEASMWYCGYIETASAYGIIKGYNTTAFGPNDTITREQAMTMIARAMKMTGLKSDIKDSEISSLFKNYSDATAVSDYAKISIAACLKTGLVKGRSGKLIAPKNYITRAEVAVIVQRLLQNSNLI